MNISLKILFTVMTFLSSSQNLWAEAEDLTLACEFKQPAANAAEAACRTKLDLEGFSTVRLSYQDAIVGQNKIIKKNKRQRVLTCRLIESFCITQNSKSDIKSRADELRSCVADFEDNALGSATSVEVQNTCIIALDKMPYREIRKCFAKSKNITLERYDQIQDLDDGVTRLIGLGTDESYLLKCLAK